MHVMALVDTSHLHMVDQEHILFLFGIEYQRPGELKMWRLEHQNDGLQTRHFLPHK